jgi:hypothetical protein
MKDCIFCEASRPNAQEGTSLTSGMVNLTRGQRTPSPVASWLGVDMLARTQSNRHWVQACPTPATHPATNVGVRP